MASRQKSAPHTDESIFKAECRLRFWGEIFFFLKYPFSRAFKSLLRDYTYHYLHVLQLTGSFISTLTGSASKWRRKPCIHKSKPPSVQEPCSQHYTSAEWDFSLAPPSLSSCKTTWNSRLTIGRRIWFSNTQNFFSH